MLHNQNHRYARKISDGNKVFIDNVPNGKKCDCICSKCQEPLIAKNGGEINIHHFAHISDSNCSGESSAHIEAKDIIKKEKYLWLPDYDEYKKVKFDDVDVEKLIGESQYRADLICKIADRLLVVEIVVTHPIDDDKELFLKQNEVNTLEIDLKSVLLKNEYDDIPTNFSELVLRESHRKWIYNGKVEKRKTKQEEEKLKRIDRQNSIAGLKRIIDKYDREIELKERSKTLPMLKPIPIIENEILDLMDKRYEKVIELQALMNS